MESIFRCSSAMEPSLPGWAGGYVSGMSQSSAAAPAAPTVLGRALVPPSGPPPDGAALLDGQLRDHPGLAVPVDVAADLVGAGRLAREVAGERLAGAQPGSALGMPLHQPALVHRSGVLARDCSV